MIIVWILLFWIGIQLDAPNWYVWLLAIMAAWKVFVD